MNYLDDVVCAKIRALLDYRNTLDTDLNANQDALAACNWALKQIAALISRLLADPSSKERRLADIDLILNGLFDDHFELRSGNSQLRGMAPTVTREPETHEPQDPIQEIIRVLIDTGYLPKDMTRVSREAIVDIDKLKSAVRDNKSVQDFEIDQSTEIQDVQSLTNAEYTVWFGTNRRPNDSVDISKGYSSERDVTIHYGTCRVFIPESHKIGSIGSSWRQRLQTWTDDRLRLLAIRNLVPGDYWRALSEELAKLKMEDRHAVVFVHGYNASFEEATLRAAQIGFDLAIKSAMAFFSWPSQGTWNGYSADEATIEASEGAITDFMTEFVDRSGAEAVHIIAHSMGNRAVLQAVNRIAGKAERRTGKHFGQIILAAADVDADLFKQMCGAYGQVALRTTLYISGRDLAVEASKWLHRYPRVGLMPPVVVVPGIDTINVTNIDMSALGHGYIAGARDVLKDIYDLITQNLSPNSRFGLRPALTEQGERYWIIGA
jgi:esterase/lipase superfamily enzyme